MRILIADDSRTLRASISDQLRGMGHEVVEASDGVEALERFGTYEPDLVVLDVEMPRMNGYEAARAIRKLTEQDWIPIIFLSGNVRDTDIAAGIEAGGDDYLSKPVSPTVLRAKLSAMQRITGMRRRLIDVTHELAIINANLRQKSTQDSLTGVLNRGAFDAIFEQEWNHSARTGKPLALLMADVDYFKRYNDNYGHQQGDECLKAVAAGLREAALRKADLVARYGGEEFALVLPDTPAVSALLVAGRLLEGVRSLRLPHEHSPVSGHVTISLGVCAAVPRDGSSPGELIRVADRALYDAKAKGRNQAVLAAFPTQ